MFFIPNISYASPPFLELPQSATPERTNKKRTSHLLGESEGIPPGLYASAPVSSDFKSNSKLFNIYVGLVHFCYSKQTFRATWSAEAVACNIETSTDQPSDSIQEIEGGRPSKIWKIYTVRRKDYIPQCGRPATVVVNKRSAAWKQCFYYPRKLFGYACMTGFVWACEIIMYHYQLSMCGLKIQ